MYKAFPCSDYYDGSDARGTHAWTAHVRIFPPAFHVHALGLCITTEVAVC
jgi:hypothetical protein